MSLQAFILAGGMGSRLGELTRNTPKPLLDVAGVPFIHYVISNLCRYNISDIVLSLGYRSEKFPDILGDGAQFGVQLRYSVEKERLGTGGALKIASDLLANSFMVLNGDTLFDLDLQQFMSTFSEEYSGAMALRRVEDVSRYGSVQVNPKGEVYRFREKGGRGGGLVNGGAYLFRKEVLGILPHGESSIEEDLFPALVKEKKLIAREYNGFFLDIGLPETYQQAQTLLPKWQKSVMYSMW